MEANCHCGSVCFEVSRDPVDIFDCNCSICRRLGTLWAYFRPDEVQLVRGSGHTDVYRWGPQHIEFHSCRTCGCTTHWQSTSNPDTARKMGINARLMDALDRSSVRLWQIDMGESGIFWPPASPEPDRSGQK